MWVLKTDIRNIFETHEICPFLLEGAFSALSGSALFKTFALICTNSVSKTWIYWNCQVILLSFLLYISLNILPVPSSQFTAFNQSLASSRCSLCMPPSSDFLTYSFPLCFKCSSFGSCELQVPVFLFLRRHTRVCC